MLWTKSRGCSAGVYCFRGNAATTGADATRLAVGVAGSVCTIDGLDRHRCMNYGYSQRHARLYRWALEDFGVGLVSQRVGSAHGFSSVLSEKHVAAFVFMRCVASVLLPVSYEAP